MAILDDLKTDLIDGDMNKVKDGVAKALQEGLTPDEIINNGLIAAMNVIGAQFKSNEIYMPEVLVAARAIIGTVKGDLHDIGKNLVKMMLEGAGFKVIDLGVDVSTEKFVQATQEIEPQLVGLSALLTTTMPQMRQTVEALAACRGQAKIIVGGAPITEKFASEIGADGYAEDAASAVDKARELLGMTCIAR
jgi:5-methyltetrahydrofolate--homocysteine methyltransferase